MSIVASGLFGMVSGSPLANVSATGSIYIPIMKENGFSAEYAGAVNATACTGGQIMPPVMGTGAFIMATMIGCSYGEICSAAAITAVLFYAALFVMVDLEAAKRGIKGLSKDELPKGKEVMKEGWHYLVSVVVLVWLLVFLQWSAGKAAFWAIVSLFGVYLAKQLLIKGKIEWMKLVDIAVSTAKGNMSIAIACACAGIVVGCFTATGLNLRLSSMLIEISGGNLFVLLLGCMVIAVIMGMGLSSTPVYILLSVMVAPAISSFGVPKLAAHLFIFFFASMATITPPVGMAFYVASGIAKSNSMKTGLVASMLGATGFLIPFVFVYDPALLMQGTILEIVLAAGRCAIGILGLSVAAEGYFRRPVNVVFRVLLIAGSFGSILPEVISTIVGIAVVLIILAIHLIPERKADVPA